MADTKKPSANKQIIDVTDSDKAPPSDNSKSVIVNSRPLLQDPMVVADTEPSEPLKTGKPDKAQKDKPPKLTPGIEAELPASKDSEPDSKPAAAAEPQPLSEPAAEASAPDKNDDDATAGQTEVTTEKNPAPNEKALQLKAETEAEAKQQALIDELTDGKKYYLPIDTLENRRSRRFVALGVLLSLVLLVAWADIALDAGIIHLSGIKPVTHFFSN